MAHVAQRILPEEAKIKIRERLRQYCDRFQSLDIAANTLKNVGATTLRNMLKPDFPNISDEMWRNVRSQIGGGGSKSEWVYVNTTVVKDLRFLMRDIQEEQGFTWAISPSGSGKTSTARLYASESKNVFHVQCDSIMSNSAFAIEFARSLGLRVNTQRDARRLIFEACDYLAELDDPLIIFDEGDKLKKGTFAFFVTIYNKISEYAGVLFLSTGHAKTVIETGLRNDWPGFQEMWSRLGRKFYVVDANNTNDVLHIAIENGLTGERDLQVVKNDAIAADLDLRRVQKKVVAIRKKTPLNDRI
jgi:DNA transposition AAA+ family ATPase